MTTFISAVKCAAILFAVACAAGPPTKSDGTSAAPWGRSVPVEYPGDDDYYYQQIVTGTELPGVKIELGSFDGFMDPEEYGKFLRITIDGHRTILRGLDQLAGHFHVTNRDEALRFVRVKTFPPIWFLMRKPTFDLEILKDSQLPTMPTYGLQDNEPYRYPQGLNGFITDFEYDEYGFREPVVKRVPGGFAVIRWLVSVPSDLHRELGVVRQVRELVTPDGHYTRTVLKTLKPDETRPFSAFYPRTRDRVPL